MSTSAQRLLDLLLQGAPVQAYDAVLAELPAEERAEAEAVHERVLLLRDQLERLRGREAELSALNDTAQDLTRLRDLDAVLTAIVRRARQLLRADMTYLSLNDEAEGASYMKVTDGALTQEFRNLRLPLGTGLLGLVAQTGEPYFTADYQGDERFLHRPYIDEAVAGEQIRAILGVPLRLEGKVIGALLAVHRRVRPFPAGEVALLAAFAAHAAVALENARLFDEAAEANRLLTERNAQTERAARAHDRLTQALITGEGVVGIAAVLEEATGGTITIRDADGAVLAGPEVSVELGPAAEEARASGHSVPVGTGRWLAVAAAGEQMLGTLLLDGVAELAQPERRTLERGALVTALVLLFDRVEAEAEARVRGELLDDLLRGREPDTARLRERAIRQGARLDGALLVAVAAAVDAERHHRVTRAAAGYARECGGLAGEHGGRLVLVLPYAEDHAAAIGDRLGAVTVGLAVAEEISEVVSAHQEATRVLNALVALGRIGETSDPAGLGLARLLLSGNGPGEFAEFLESTIGPLRTYDQRRGTALLDTLAAWFDAGGSPTRAAQVLHVHPNTVAQRLDRIGQLLGEQWREPGRALDLQLAVRLLRLTPPS